MRAWSGVWCLSPVLLALSCVVPHAGQNICLLPGMLKERVKKPLQTIWYHSYFLSCFTKKKTVTTIVQYLAVVFNFLLSFHSFFIRIKIKFNF